MSTKSILILFGIIFIVFIGLKVWEFHWPSINIILDGQRLHMLVANTSDHRFQGLSNRHSLSQYDGMLFVFPSSGLHGIVMRHMDFSLDIVWVENGKIVYIKQNLRPDNRSESQLIVYKPSNPANAVLELPAGWVSIHGTKIGDRVVDAP